MTTEVNTITHYDLSEDGYGACMRVSATEGAEITIMTGPEGAVVDQTTNTEGLRDLAKGLLTVADRIDGKAPQAEPAPLVANVERGGFRMTTRDGVTHIYTESCGMNFEIRGTATICTGGFKDVREQYGSVEALFQLADGIRTYAEQQSGRTLAAPEVKAEPKIYSTTRPDRDTTIINAPGLWGGELRIEKDDSDSTFKLSFNDDTDPSDYEWVKKDAFYAFAQALKDYADAL